MNLTTFDAKPFAIILAIILTMLVLNVCSQAYYTNTTYEETEFSYCWDRADISMWRIRNYLIDNGWVDERVTKDDFEYITQLAIHLSSYYEDISPALTLAVITQESKFYHYDEYNGALGLMQLLPSYHSDRLICCLEEDERYSKNLFFDPRLNIMTGLDYLHQLLEEVNGDIPYALMCYNQGPSSAYKTYVKNGIISDYAKNIVKLSEELDELLPGS